jgi:hypothetical protein
MKLIVRIANQEEDHNCYNIVAKTKKECLLKVKEWAGNDTNTTYKELFKCEIECKDMFDFFERLTSEGGGRSPHSMKILKKENINE